MDPAAVLCIPLRFVPSTDPRPSTDPLIHDRPEYPIPGREQFVGH